MHVSYYYRVEFRKVVFEKFFSRYNCDGTTYNGCGGHVYGDEGTLDALDDDKCQWMIRVEDGYAVEISVITFDVSC